MAVQSFVGSFAQPAATGAQAITGVGFTPKLVLFYYNGLTADGGGARGDFGFGAADGTHVDAFGSATNDNTNPPFMGSGSSSTRCILIAKESAGTVSLAADATFTSFDADGFTVNWQTADATARIVNFIAYGGSDLANVEVGHFNQSNSVGVQTVTMAGGFTPNLVLLAWPNSVTGLGPNWGAAITNIDTSPGLGAMTASAQVFATYRGRNNFTPSREAKNQYTTAVTMGWSPNSGLTSPTDLAAFSSFGAGAFAINWSLNTATGYGMMYVAIQATNATVGEFTQPTTATSVAVSGFGYKPAGLFFFTDWTVAAENNGVGSTDSYFGVGASDGTHQGALSRVGENGDVTGNYSQALDRTKALTVAIVGHGSPSLAYIDGTAALDSDGFTVTFQHMGDASQRRTPYVALGPSGTLTADTFTAAWTSQGTWLPPQPARMVASGPMPPAVRLP